MKGSKLRFTENIIEKQVLGLSKKKQLEAKELELNVEFELRVQQLYGIDKLSEALSEQLKEKKQHIESLNTFIQKNCEELGIKEKQHDAIQISIEDKEREFDHIKRYISNAAKKLNLLEKIINKSPKKVQEC